MGTAPTRGRDVPDKGEIGNRPDEMSRMRLVLRTATGTGPVFIGLATGGAVAGMVPVVLAAMGAYLLVIIIAILVTTSR
jgi:hypothetical protein